MAADGSLKFDTKVDTSDFDVSISTLEKAVDRLSKTIDKLSGMVAKGFGTAGSAASEAAKDVDVLSASAETASKDMESIGNAAKESEQRVKSLQEQMDAISIHDWQDNVSDVASGTTAAAAVAVDQKSMQYDPKAMAAAFGEAAAEIHSYADAVRLYGNQAGASLNEMGSGVAESTTEISNAAEESEQHINPLKQEITDLRAKLKELENAGFYFGDTEYDSAYQSLKRLESELAEYKKQLMSTKETGQAAGSAEMEYVSLTKSVMNGLAIVWKAFRSIPHTARNSMGQIPGIVRNGFSSAAHIAANFGRQLGSSVVNGAKRAAAGLQSLIKPSNKVSTSILKLSNMFKLMLIRMGMRAAIQGVREGMQNLVQYSSEANQSMSDLTTGATYMKNSFAAAFAPILSVVAPILNTLINLLATALNYINQFFAALGGAATFVKAKRVNEDYAKSLKATGCAAKQAGKDAKKALAPFDELTVLQEQAAAGSGGGGAGADSSQMFETVTVDSAVKTMADKIKSLFSDLFTPFGEAWKKDGEGVINSAKYALSALMNLTESVGESFADIWTNGTGTQMLSEILQITQNVLNIIGNITTRLNEAWNTNQIGTQIIQNVFVLLLSILSTINGITNAAALWAATLDFTPLLTSINDLLIALQPLTDNIGEGLEWFWNNVLLPVASWTIEDAVPTFLDMLASAIDTVNKVTKALEPAAQWLWDNFLEPLGEWTGTAIITAMETISDLLNKIGDWVSQHGEAVSQFATIVGMVAAAFISVKSGIGFVIAVVPKFIALIKSVVAILTGPVGIVIALAAMVVAMGEGQNMIDSMKTALSGLINFVAGVFTGDWERAWSGVKDIFKGVFNGIVTILESAVNFVVTGLNKVSFDIPEWVPGFGGKTFGFALQEVHLPRLASGTVVPPRAGEFAAILGDNNREAEVVSPISAMKQAFREIVEEMGQFGGDIRLTVNLDGKVIYNEVVKRNQQTTERTGKNPLLA